LAALHGQNNQDTNTSTMGELCQSPEAPQLTVARLPPSKTKSVGVVDLSLTKIRCEKQFLKTFSLLARKLGFKWSGIVATLSTGDMAEIATDLKGRGGYFASRKINHSLKMESSLNHLHIT
jgi:hypothetical protein